MKILALIAALSLTACLKDETISGQTDATETWVLTQLNLLRLKSEGSVN